MLIVGAGSAGKETLGILNSFKKKPSEIVFYDEGNEVLEMIFDKYKVIKEYHIIEDYLKTKPEFCVAIGHPRLREKMYKKIILLGGIPTNIIASSANTLSDLENNGSIIQTGAAISYEVIIGKSCMIHANAVIGHKCIIGDFVNISPLSALIGPVKIGNFSYIGTGAIILPDITIGNNVYVQAGSVVNRHLNDYETF